MSQPPLLVDELSLAERLAVGPPEEAEAFLAGLTKREADLLLTDWAFHGRPKQQWPGSPGHRCADPTCGRGAGDDDWTTWALIAGRGMGKTRSGAESTRKVAESGEVGLIHLIAPTPADYRDVMIEGPAGIQAISPRWSRPEWFPSKRLVLWPNGVKALCFCATPDTEALTRDRGWVTHETLNVGDVILTWNTLTGFSEWQPMSAVHRFDVSDEPLVAIGGRYHASLTTGGHRWPILDRFGNIRWTTSSAIATGKVDTHTRLLAAAPCADLPMIAKYDDAFVELVAWAWTEGCATLNSRPRMVISQSLRVNPTHCASIDRAIREVFGPPREAQAVGNNQRVNGMEWRTYRQRDLQIWQLDPDAASTVFDCFDGNICNKVVSISFILSLTRAQLELFVARSVDGDGHRKTPGCYSLAQNNRERLDRFALALTLLGIPHSVTKLDTTYPFWQASTRRSPTLSLMAGIAANGSNGASNVTATTFTGTVWCPTTPTGTWFARRNGHTFITGNSAEDPEALRGPQCGFIWADEIGAWTYGEATWDMAQLGLRMGRRPRQVITTTPKPFKWLKKILADDDTHLTRGTTYENLQNLAETFKRTILSKYEGTRLGRQELMAEILEAVEGALWTPELLETTRRFEAPHDGWQRVVVAVDPAVSATADSDETGIVVSARASDGDVYVLEDCTPGRVKPGEWGRAALAAYHRHKADAIVAEVNNGGDMVIETIQNLDPGGYVKVEKIHASRGKFVRAEPISALFEQGRAHLLGTFPLLEEQMTSWVPAAKGQDSPDRIDAAVYSLTELTQGRRARLIA